MSLLSKNWVLVAIFFAPAIVLIIWFLGIQIPQWTGAQPDWITNDDKMMVSPGTCTGAQMLRHYQASQTNSEPLIHTDIALQVAQGELTSRYSTATIEISDPNAFTIQYEGQHILAWLVTAAFENGDAPADVADITPTSRVAALLIHGEDGFLIDIFNGYETRDPALTCPNSLRIIMLNAVRTTPFLLLLVYVGIVTLIFFVWVVFKQIRSARRKGQLLRMTEQKNTSDTPKVTPRVTADVHRKNTQSLRGKSHNIFARLGDRVRRLFKKRKPEEPAQPPITEDTPTVTPETQDDATPPDEQYHRFTIRIPKLRRPNRKP